MMFKVYRLVGLTYNQMSENSFSVGSAVDIFQHRKDSQQNTKTLSDLKQIKVLSGRMANKMGESGLCLAHLKLIVQQSGLAALPHLLSETSKLITARIFWCLKTVFYIVHIFYSTGASN